MENFSNRFDLIRKNSYTDFSKVNEGMDFSNGTGWHQCLVGRLINKGFSFFLKKFQEKQLRELKEKLEGVYLAGVLATLADIEVSAEDISSDKSCAVNISVSLINNNTKDEIVENRSTDENTYEFILPKDESLANYRTDIKVSDGTTWVNSDNKQENYNPVTNNMYIMAKAENGDSIKINIVVNISGQLKAKNNNASIVVDLKKKNSDVYLDPEKIAEKNVITIKIKEDLANVVVMVKPEDDNATIDTKDDLEAKPEMKYVITAENGEKKEWILKILQDSEAKNKTLALNPSGSGSKALSNGEQTEDSKKTLGSNQEKGLEKTKDSSSTNMSKNTQSDDKNIQQSKEGENKEQGNSTKSDKKTVLREYEQTKKIVDSLLSKVTDPEKRAKIEKAAKIAKSFLQPEKSEIERKSAIESINRLLKQVDSTVNIASTNENSEYYDVLLDRIFEKIDNVLSNYTINEALASSIGTYPSIKDVLAQAGEEGSFKNAIERYGKIKMDKIDIGEILKVFNSKPELRQEAIKMVDKEEIKRIGYVADLMYNKESSKAADELYSRVNFAKTDPDKAKLENKWKQYVAQAKSTYSPFLIDEKGNFPMNLDPIALIKSDDTIRTNFNQFTTEHGGGNFKEREKLEKTIMDKTPIETQKDLKVISSSNGLADSKFGVVNFEINVDGKTNKDLAIVVSNFKYTDKEKLYFWKYIKLVNYSNIIKEYYELSDEDKNDSEKMKNIIIKNDYSTNEKRKNNITDTTYKSTVDKIYGLLRALPKDFDYEKNILITTFVEDLRVGEKKISFTPLTISKVGDVVTNYASVVDMTNYKSTLIDIKDVNVDEKKKYKLLLNIKEIFEIENKYLLTWGIDLGKEEQKIEMVKNSIKNNPDILDKLVKLCK